VHTFKYLTITLWFWYISLRACVKMIPVQIFHLHYQSHCMYFLRFLNILLFDNF
jgi:hypothetical protein